MKIGYARCSTEKQDVTAQREQLAALGVASDRMYVDEGFTGTNRNRPMLGQALAAVRAGDELVVTKLDRLARSVPDARAIAAELTEQGVKLAIAGNVYDPTDPMGKLFFNALAMFAEFEADIIRMRTREGMAIARAKGKLKGKPAKLTNDQRAGLLALHKAGNHNVTELAAMFNISRPTVYRELQKAGQSA